MIAEKSKSLELLVVSHLYRICKYKTDRTDSGHEAAIASSSLAGAKIAAAVATGVFEAGG